MINKFTEKRENVRTCLTAKVMVKRVSKEFADGFSGFFIGMEGLSEAVSKKNGSQTTIPDSMIGMMLGLDEKLDLIISMLSEDRNLAQKRCDALDISGTGLCVIMNEEAKFGDNYEVTVRFSGLPVRVLKACAEVVRVSPYLDKKFEVGMRFKGLTETEKESIISITFSENRKRIRENRTIWEND